MLDNDKLISMVHSRRPLWDVKSRHYHNRDVARKLWQEIADEMGTKEPDVKARWQNLRDIFRREHSKYSKGIEGLAQQATWRYYDQLLFIADMTKIKSKQKVDVKSEGVELLTPMSIVDVEVSNSSADVQDMDAVSGEEDPLRIDSSNEVRPVKFKLNNINELDSINQFLQLEMRKMEQMERLQKMKEAAAELEKDEDYNFLMSLLPHFRDIPKQRKLVARMRFQQILVDEIEMAIH